VPLAPASLQAIAELAILAGWIAASCITLRHSWRVFTASHWLRQYWLAAAIIAFASYAGWVGWWLAIELIVLFWIHTATERHIQHIGTLSPAIGQATLAITALAGHELPFFFARIIMIKLETHLLLNIECIGHCHNSYWCHWLTAIVEGYGTQQPRNKWTARMHQNVKISETDTHNREWDYDTQTETFQPHTHITETLHSCQTHTYLALEAIRIHIYISHTHTHTQD